MSGRNLFVGNHSKAASRRVHYTNRRHVAMSGRVISLRRIVNRAEQMATWSVRSRNAAPAGTFLSVILAVVALIGATAGEVRSAELVETAAACETLRTADFTTIKDAPTHVFTTRVAAAA